MRNLRTQEEIIQNWKGDINEPIVTVLCTTYNHEKYIEDAIEGFLIQETDFPFEIIIHDDASTDKTADIVREYEAKYPEIIKGVYQTVNRFSQGKKNAEILYPMSRGEYIALCEGDDYWTDLYKLQIQIDTMKEYPEVDMSFHLASTVDGLNIERYPKLQKKGRLYSLEEIIVGGFHLVQTCTMVLKKEKINSLNSDLLSRSPVGDVWIRVHASMPNGALFVNKIMSTYRIQSQGSWSSSIQEESQFIKFVGDMIRSIDSFDKYWEFQYTDAFFIYKNMFIESVIKKNISQNLKKNFVDNHKNLMSYKNLLQWNILYKHSIIVKYLQIFKNNIKGLLNVKKNTK